MENWHQKHKEESNFPNKLADYVAAKMGSWSFIIIQTIVVIIWMILNILGFMYEWDKYPFILLNLLFSTQAAYAAPIIMMSQNRQNDRDRVKAESDYNTNKNSNLLIHQLIAKIDHMDIKKLDRIMDSLDIKEPEKIEEDTIDVFMAASKIYPNAGEFMERIAFEQGAKWHAKQIKKE